MNFEVNLWRFAGIYVLTWAGVTAVAIALLIGFGFELSNSATAMIPALIAAQDAGRKYYNTYGSLPDSGFAWSASFKMTLVEITITLPLAGVFGLAVFADEADASPMTFYAILAGVLAFVYFAGFLFKRYIFMAGAKSASKQQRKQDAATAMTR